MPDDVFTIGHSTHASDKFIELLRTHRIEVLADVRSHPYSRFNPQFNRESLQSDLKSTGLKYVFLGRELGARSDDRTCYVEGAVQYDRLAATSLFQEGLDRVLEGVRTYRIAL